MHRCDLSAGTFRVELQVLRAKEEVRARIMSHTALTAFKPDGSMFIVEDPPSVSTLHPYEGELCEHELAWLEADPPAYQKHYIFTVTPLE